ncbi:hypothetical protein CK203_029685 [Vitis vinifera]|uniref:Uncharacterized protein n=1 Tax=Vitis vinifera TaxID=29760 RepID=A0A438IIE7_VITVI|nr:hypothetical protein CK203_029685 [Vitis vinifera]
MIQPSITSSRWSVNSVVWFPKGSRCFFGSERKAQCREQEKELYNASFRCDGCDKPRCHLTDPRPWKIHQESITVERWD